MTADNSYSSGLNTLCVDDLFHLDPGLTTGFDSTVLSLMGASMDGDDDPAEVLVEDEQNAETGVDAEATATATAMVLQLLTKIKTKGKDKDGETITNEMFESGGKFDGCTPRNYMSKRARAVPFVNDLMKPMHSQALLLVSLSIAATAFTHMDTLKYSSDKFDSGWWTASTLPMVTLWQEMGQFPIIEIIVATYKTGNRFSYWKEGRGRMMGLLLRWWMGMKIQDVRDIYLLLRERGNWKGPKIWLDAFPTEDPHFTRSVVEYIDMSESLKKDWKTPGPSGLIYQSYKTNQPALPLNYKEDARCVCATSRSDGLQELGRCRRSGKEIIEKRLMAAARRMNAHVNANTICPKVYRYTWGNYTDKAEEA